MKEQLEQLKKTFHEIFQTDQAELDFGIYRIMREKREEFDRYLEGQLLNDLRQSFRKWQDKTSEDLQRQLNEAINGAIALGFDPEDAPKVKELRETIEAVKHRESLEESVLSDIVQFLRRYYKEGDFLSLPRYRKNSYAIEYNGEEVKLHWANADQYYVKAAERFRDYRFRLADGRVVYFKIKAANTEAGDNKGENGKERRFQLVEDEFLREENGELLIFFRYETDEQKRKQVDINTETARRILEERKDFLEWRKALGQPAPTEKKEDRTLLDKNLAEYTARNTFDYFIHKDLEGFLRRELDFFIKNEIVMLDDIENEDAPRVELYLAKVKALRRVGHKLIKFLAQVENFQKKLFLKKKFVIRTDYCVTLDRVPHELWTDVLANEAQINEWRRLYTIDEIEPDLFNGGHHLTEQFLEANQNLIVDTRHFADAWKVNLLASFDDLDASVDGILIKSDNFHALNLLQEKYQSAVSCIYIDPPYNTAVSEILYKNGYKHSSWLSLLNDRFMLARTMMREDSIWCITIDDYEVPYLSVMLLDVFGEEHHLATVVIRSKPQGRAAASGFSVNHEYAIFVSQTDKAVVGRLPRDEEKAARYSERDEEGIYAWSNFRKTGGASTRGERPRLFYPVFVSSKGIRIPEMSWGEKSQSWSLSCSPEDYEEVVYPIDENGQERVWSLSCERARKEIGELVAREVGSRMQIYRKYRPNQEGTLPGTWWESSLYSASESGTKVLQDILGNAKQFSYPKSLYAVIDCLRASNITEEYEAIILDYFAGSGTTAHAVINFNREDDGRRKYILVETNEYFDTVTLPRIKKVVYAKEWKDGKPIKREGTPHVLKYFALESYEDTMNNLELNRTEEQEQGLLNFTNEFREDYLLNYMLEFEAQGSQSLLNLDNFAAPFDYRMKIAVNGVGETQETPVDLVETFNYLIGLNVQKVQQIDGFRVVRGVTRKGERCLILWRTTKDLNQDLTNKRLNDFLEKQNFDFSDVDTLYINGDAAIPIGNVRKETDTWQIKMIEAKFLRRMFE